MVDIGDLLEGVAEKAVILKDVTIYLLTLVLKCVILVEQHAPASQHSLKTNLQILFI